MARIRTIKPEFWKNEDLSAQPEATHMLAAALLNYADDNGYFNANVGLIKAECCPLREPSVSVQDSLNLLASIGYLQLGIGQDGRRYGHIVKFDNHQVVNRPTRSKIKPLNIVWDQSSTAHAQLSEDSPSERNREQGKEQGKKPSSAAAPETPPAADLDTKRQEREQRLVAVTGEAISTFNASRLVKPNGGMLATVNPRVGRETRQKEVQRCITVARQICEEDYGSDRITAEFWSDLWAAYHADDFHAGRQRGGRGHENWLPDFEYLIRPATILKIYDRATGEGGS